MKTDTIRSKAETRVALCYVFGLIGKEAATMLNVSYNTISGIRRTSTTRRESRGRSTPSFLGGIG